MNENKWTKANRRTEVIRHEIRPEVVGSAPGFSKDRVTNFGNDFRDLEDGDTVWVVWITTRTGLDKESNGATFFHCERAAKEAVSSMPVGTVYGDEFGFPMRFREFFSRASKAGSSHDFLSRFFGVGDEEAVHFKCYEALSEAGVICKKSYETSQAVLDWLGQDHINWMRENLGENWSCVGELEYCVNHFPDSSLATLAAKLFVAQFVTHDDFAAGYLTKEIEAIAGGTEEVALQSTNARKKAGEGGGKAARERREANLETLMREIEKLSDAANLVSEDLILAQAQKSAGEFSNKMPKSKATLADYETTLRSVEPFKSRYEAVFRKNT